MARKRSQKKNETLFRQITTPELKKGELRKLQIVEATIDCLAKQGWLKTNYETVGQICGMKRPHVAYHYPVWDDLIGAVVKFVYASGAAVVADYLRDASGPKEQLRAYIEGTFHAFTTHPKHAAAFTMLWHLATFDKKYRKVSTEAKRLGAERLHVILFPSKELDTKHPRWNLVLTIHALIVGRSIEYGVTDSDLSAADLAEATFEQAWKIFEKSAKL